MNNWKKLLGPSLCLGLCLSLAGCSPQTATQTTQAPVAQSQTTQTQEQRAHPATVSAEPATSDSSLQRIAATTGKPNTALVSAAQPSPAGQDNSNLLLGNPSNAGTDPNNFLVERPQHALSYNKANGEANWVGWHLQKSNLGNVRRGEFWPDPLLPPDMQIRPNDYRGSGYDRGHVCPSGDRTSSRADNTATFVMSNMLPQAAALNQQVWKDLEDYCRYLAKGGGELYIIAGGSGSAERIAEGKVNVPTVCWKIILVLPLGDNDLQRINSDTRIIAVSMPNRDRPEIADSKWAQWITSVAQLEKTTGYDFLSALPDDVEKTLEQKVDSGRAKSTPRDAADASGSAIRTVTAETDSASAPVSPIPRPEEPNPKAANRTATVGQVWVNTRSGVYHYPGARWYGNTKQGAYMSEAEATAQGYRAAQNGQ